MFEGTHSPDRRPIDFTSMSPEMIAQYRAAYVYTVAFVAVGAILALKILERAARDPEYARALHEHQVLRAVNTEPSIASAQPARRRVRTNRV
jgi:hypothetical protein